jgi:hypothetical protein
MYGPSKLRVGIVAKLMLNCGGPPVELGPIELRGTAIVYNVGLSF